MAQDVNAAPHPAFDRSKSVEERDREWLANVYRGDTEPQLTTRAILTGMVFGGIMSLSNLYVGLKSGWGLGVDIIAIIVMFSIFKGLKGVGLVKREFGMMESTIMMTAAVAASWISSAGLVSAVPALTMLTGYKFVWWQLTAFIGIVLYSGLFMAIPFKRQMIQVDHLRFPGNIPTSETLKAMYSKGGEAMKKAKSLGIAGMMGVIVASLRDGLADKVTWIGAWMKPQYAFGNPSILNVPLSKLTTTFEPSLIFIGIGALFGIKVGMSMLLGLVLNYGVLAPNLINDHIIRHVAPQVRAETPPSMPLSIPAGLTFAVVVEEANKTPELDKGSRVDTFVYRWTQPVVYGNTDEIEKDFNAATLKDGSPNPFYGVVGVRDTANKALGKNVLFAEASKAVTWESKLTIPENQPSDQLAKALGFKPGATRTQVVGGFRNISAWSLWPGATILVVGGLLALAFQWRTLGKTFGSIFSGLGRKKNGPKGVLDHIEVPMSWFVPGFVITGFFAVLLLIWLFDIHWYMGVIAVLMTFFLAAVAARAGAEIGINPIGALGKVTQLTYGAIAPGNIPANLMTAGVTAGAAASCSDTVGNLFVGYQVGANPRKQFIAQLFGVIAGAMMAVPAYFILVPDPTALPTDKFAVPSALVWMGVAKVLAQGFSTLPRSAIVAIIVAFILGVIIVVSEKIFPKIKPYTPSPTALGIALTIPAYTSFSMFLGSAIVWVLERKAKNWNEMFTIPVASGWIAGESIMGVVLAGLTVLIANGTISGTAQTMTCTVTCIVAVLGILLLSRRTKSAA
jgi:uncharacterized oligopeptide transporter (OPT) family protein